MVERSTDTVLPGFAAAAGCPAPGRTCEDIGTTTGGTISVRTVSVTALLVCAGLALTACRTDDTGGSAAVSSSASPGHGARKQPAADPSASPSGSCPALAPGHRRIWVSVVTGAMNDITFRNAELVCPDGGRNGASYRRSGRTTTLPWKTGSKVTYIAKGGGHRTDALGIGHVRACALKATHPEGTPNESIPAHYYCYGRNYYDVLVDGRNRIAEMTELYVSRAPGG